MKHLEGASFLSILAQHTLEQYGTNLHHCCFIFPSQRASTFFRYELSKQISTPLLSPQIITVERLTEGLSNLRLAERTHQVSLLYREIVSLREELGFPIDEKVNPNLPFDHAEKLLSDFNDIDNYLVDPDEIFHNLKALDDLTSLDYLSPQQQEAIELYFGRLNRGNVDKKQRLEELFSAMTTEMQLLYHRFRATLESLGIGYSGMLARRANELSEADFKRSLSSILDPSVRHIIVSGLYHISTAEKSIFKRLKRLSQAIEVSFYWEKLSLNNLSNWYPLVGNTVEESQKELGGEWITPSLQDAPEIELVQIPSGIGRSKMIPSLIQRINETAPDAIDNLQCAILLPEVNTLLPLLDALRSLPNPINITMGYPLHLSSVAIWIHRYIELQQYTRLEKNGIKLPVEALNHLFKHPLSRLFLEGVDLKPFREVYKGNFYYLDYQRLEEAYQQRLPETLKILLEPIKDNATLLSRLTSLLDRLASLLPLNNTLSEQDDKENHLIYIRDLELEFIERYRSLVTRIDNLLPFIGNLTEPSILYRLLFKLVEGEAIPFEGEPLEGLQIMGFLESRLINFDYIIIPDANEKSLPHKRSKNRGYIPHHLRIGYGMPSYRSEDYTETYYFYRLICRAKKVFFVVDSRSSEEPSRFIAQLRYIFHIMPKEHSVQFSLSSLESSEIIVPKDTSIIDRLREYTNESSSEDSRALSASSLATYASCPLRFYYKYVRHISEIEEHEELVSSKLFGTVIHNVMQTLYHPFEGQALTLQDYTHLLDPQLSSLRIRKLIIQQYARDVLNKETATANETQGMHEMYIGMIEKEIHAILRFDAQLIQNNHQLTYLASEQKIYLNEPLPALNLTVQIKGYIDRMDEVDGRLRIVDYKTGADKSSFGDWSQLYFPRSSTLHTKAIAQLFLYSEAIVRLAEDFKKNREQYPWLQAKHTNIQPALYLLREMCTQSSDFDSSIFLREGRNTSPTPICNYADGSIRLRYRGELQQILLQIFSPEIPFTQTKDKYICSYCAFRAICNR
ncbi:MAG: PD-(D/E)XK nuclease family protein [Porphyromonas sp.]|nr:PD-(D/E)XK nuclease family protein [Porphyromonas sp.]